MKTRVKPEAAKNPNRRKTCRGEEDLNREIYPPKTRLWNLCFRAVSCSSLQFGENASRCVNGETLDATVEVSLSRSWASAPLSGAKGLGVLHHLPIFRTFTKIPQVPSFQAHSPMSPLKNAKFRHGTAGLSNVE